MSTDRFMRLQDLKEEVGWLNSHPFPIAGTDLEWVLNCLRVARRVAELFEECPDDYHQERAEGFHEDSSECPTCWGAGVVPKEDRVLSAVPGDYCTVMGLLTLARFLFGEE